VAGVDAVFQLLEPDFPEQLEARAMTSDREWLTDRLLEHEQVVEACLPLGPVYPFGFAVIFPDRNALSAYLEPLRGELAGYFERVRDCREWGVKIRAIVDEPSRAEQAAGAASGAAYLLARRERPLRMGRSASSHRGFGSLGSPKAGRRWRGNRCRWSRAPQIRR
jgi:hypothetical protein